MFKILAGLAWRNIWRIKRRTILTLMTILVGSAMIIFLNAMATGGHDKMIDDAVGLNAGHIQVHEKGYQDNRSIDYAFIPSAEMTDYLGAEHVVQAWGPRAQTGILLASGEVTRGAMLQGVDPVREKTLSELHRSILPKGRYLLPTDKKSIVLGSMLAKNLKIGVGDRLSIISQGFDGSIAASHVKVVGVFESGNPEYDRTLVQMPLAEMRSIFALDDYIQALTVRVKDPSRTGEVTKHLEEIASRHEYPLEVLDYASLMPELMQFIVMDDVSAWVFDFILFMVVAFAVLNTVQMSVFERTREFGIMLALGNNPAQIVALVMLETLYIALIGLLLGVMLGGGISIWFAWHPIDYSAYAEEIAVWGISTTTYPARLTMLNVAVTVLLTLVLALIFALFPARRAAKLDPVNAIRQL